VLVSAEMQKKFVEAIKQASVVIDAAEKQADETLATQTKVASLLPGCVALLIDRGLVKAALKAQLEGALNDHARTLELLSEVAKMATPAGPKPLGAGVKSATDRFRRGGVFLDAREGEDDRESDQILFEGFGIR
jgi:hypothetical protein